MGDWINDLLADLNKGATQDALFKKYPRLNNDKKLYESFQGYNYTLISGGDEQKANDLYPEISRLRIRPFNTDYKSNARANPNRPVTAPSRQPTKQEDEGLDADLEKLKSMSNVKQPSDISTFNNIPEKVEALRKKEEVDRANKMFQENFANSQMGKVFEGVQASKAEEDARIAAENQAKATEDLRTGDPLKTIWYQALNPMFTTSQAWTGNMIGSLGMLTSDLLAAVTGDQAISQAGKEKSAEIMEWFKKNQSDKAMYRKGASGLTEPLQQKGSIVNDGKANFNAIIPRLAETITGMGYLIVGSEIMGGGQAGLMASSMLATYAPSREDAISAGFSNRQAEEYAVINSAIQSVLELISPNDIVAGRIKSKISGELVKRLSKDLTRAEMYSEIAKAYGKEIAAENIQELSQTLAEKGTKYAFNQINEGSGEGFKDTKFSKDEVLETILLTTLATGAVSTPGIIAQTRPSQIKKGAYVTASTNMPAFEDMLQRAIERGDIAEEDAANIYQDVSDFKKTYDQAKQAGYSDDQAANMTIANKAKNSIQQAVKETSSNPVLQQTGQFLQSQLSEMDEAVKDASMGIPKIGDNVSGLDVVKIVDQIGDKGRDITEERAKEIGENDYTLEEVDLVKLSQDNKEFRQLAREYSVAGGRSKPNEGETPNPEIKERLKNFNEEGLRVPAILKGSKVVDGMHRLAYLYSSGKNFARVFKALETENNTITTKTQNNEGQEERQETVLSTAKQPAPGQAVSNPSFQEYRPAKGGYRVTYENGKRVVRSANGRNLDDNSQKAKLAKAAHARNYNYNFGKKIDEYQGEVPQFSSDEEMYDWVIENSDNPAEIAHALTQAPKSAPSLSETDMAIARHGIETYMESYSRFGDPNNMSKGKRLAYIRKRGDRRLLSIDQIAKSISDDTGLNVEPSDIVDFMDRFPNGVREALKEVDGSAQTFARQKFEQITDIPLTDDIAAIAARQYLESGKAQAVDQALQKELDELTDDELENELIQTAIELQGQVDSMDELTEADWNKLFDEYIKEQNETSTQQDQQKPQAQKDVQYDEASDEEPDTKQDVEQDANEADSENEVGSFRNVEGDVEATNPELVKAVEQSLNETPQAGSVGVGGDNPALKDETPILSTPKILSTDGLPNLEIVASKEASQALESEIGGDKGVIDKNVRTIPIQEYDVASNKRSKQIAEQIEENGWIEPLIVSYDKNGNVYIVEGQHRAAALKELGYDKAPVIVIHEKDLGKGRTQDDVDAISEELDELLPDNQNEEDPVEQGMNEDIASRIIKEWDGQILEFNLPRGQKARGKVIKIDGLDLDIIMYQPNGSMEIRVIELSTTYVLGTGMSEYEAINNSLNAIKGKEKDLTAKLISAYKNQKYSHKHTFYNKSPAIETFIENETKDLPFLYDESEIERLKSLSEKYKQIGELGVAEFLSKIIGSKKGFKIDLDLAERRFEEVLSEIDKDQKPLDYTEEPETIKLSVEERRKRAITKAKNRYEREIESIKRSKDIFEEDLLISAKQMHDAELQKIQLRYDALAEAEKLPPPSSQSETAAAEAELDKAKRELKSAEDEISKTNAAQSGLFGNSEQSDLFGTKREDAKSILDPLRDKVKAAQEKLDKARRKEQVDRDSNSDKLFSEEPKTTTLKMVNAALQSENIPVEIVRGDGYYYFIPSDLDIPSLYQNTLDGWTTAELVNYVKEYQNNGAIDLNKQHKQLTNDLLNRQKELLNNGVRDFSTDEKWNEINDGLKEIEAVIGRQEQSVPQSGQPSAQSKSQKASEKRQKAKDDFKNAFKDFKNGMQNLGFSPDEQTDRQAKMIAMGIKLVKAYAEEGIYKFQDIINDIANDIKELGQEFFEAIKKAYVTAYLDDETGLMDDPKMVKSISMPSPDDVKPASDQFDPKVKFMDAVRESISSGLKMDIRTLRSLAKDHSYVASDTDLQEDVELVLTGLARTIAAKPSLSPSQKMADLIDLYNRQPSLNMRDSDRVILQQYSTPIPIAFAGSHFLNLGNKTGRVLEPSAGNGMLVHAIPISNIIANEKDEKRANNLRDQGIFTLQQDAKQPFPENMEFDGLIMNPPFGPSEKENFNGYELNGLEEVMSANALESLKDNGRAVIIMGRHTQWDDKGRIKGAELRFFNYLHNQYNVADVINIDGDLYSRQGTRYDIRMILIDGRKANPSGAAPLRTDAAAEVVDSFERLFNRINSVNESLLQSGMVPEQQPGDAVLDTPGQAEQDAEQGRSTGEGAQAVSANNTGRNGRRGRPSRNNTPGSRNSSGQQPIGPDLFTGNNNEQPVPDMGVSVSETGGPGEGRRNESKRSYENPPGYQPTRISEPTVTDLVNNEKVNYVPFSKAKSLGSKIPSSMYAESRAAIQRLVERVGDIDNFVQDKLQYNTREELYKALGAEQVDAVALAINNIDNGEAAIIGDMTGIGKGRIAASIVRYGILQGKKPIFLTEKPNLYSDLWRDIVATGSSKFRPFVLASDKRGDVVEPDEKFPDKLTVVFKAQDSRSSAFTTALQNGEFPKGYDYMMTTYSQFNGGYDKEGRPVSDKSRQSGARDRRHLLTKLAENNILILDEAHNASGVSDEKNKGKLIDFVKKVLELTSGVIYLSATYAKRPDNMPVYSMKTVLKESGLSDSQLTEAFKKGGVALQEIVSSQLVSEGQMIRREHQFNADQITYNVLTESSSVDRKRADAVIELIRDIIKFQKDYVTPAIEQIDDDIKVEGASAGMTRGTQDMGVTNVLFASKVFNVVNQMLLSLKAETVANKVIETIKNGEKPVIALANTMESQIQDFATDEALPTGDFSQVLFRGLEGVMRYSVNNGQSVNPIKHTLKPSDLGKKGYEEYYKLREKIKNATTGLALSPLDLIQDKIREAGFTVKEITGREKRVEKNENGAYFIRLNPKRNVQQVSLDFNSGNLDAIIINVSGATGLSLHASRDFKDQRQRRMFMMQMELNVSTEVQKRGRIDRTNQVLRGKYDYMVSDIPAENRLLMMFRKKMRSLDANTSANQKVQSSELGATDFINKYGAMVIVQYLSENPEINERMQDPLKLASKSDEEIASLIDGNGLTEDDALKVTGRVAILTIKEQEEFYAEVLRKYEAKIEQLNSMDMNDLEVETVDLQAETVYSETYLQGDGGRSVFGRDVVLEKAMVKMLRKPLTLEQVKEQMAKFEGQNIAELMDDAAGKYNQFRNSEKEAARESMSKKIQTLMEIIDEEGSENKLDQKEIDTLKEEKNKQLLDELQDRINAIDLRYDGRINGINSLFRKFRPGQAVLYPIAEEGSLFGSPGVFLGYEINQKAKNPYAPSSIKMRFAVTDERVSPIITGSSTKWINSIHSLSNTNATQLRGGVDNFWKKPDVSVKQERYILTGNLLKALGSIQGGRLVQYTTADGNIKKGFLMGREFKPEIQKQSVKIDSQAAKDQLLKDGLLQVITPDNKLDVQISRGNGGKYVMLVQKATSRGGKYFKDPDIINLVHNNNFTQVGSMMQADFSEVNSMLDLLSKKFSLRVSFDDKKAKPKLGRKKVGRIEKRDISDLGKALSNIREKFKGDNQIQRAIDFLSPIIAKNKNIRLVDEVPAGYAAIPGALGTSYPDGSILINWDLIDSEETLYRVLLHEMIHAATRNEIEINSAFKNELNNILAEVREVLNVPSNEALISMLTQLGILEEGKYGTTNAHEMVAEIFSNRQFYEYLKNHTYKGQKSLLERIIDRILAFFSKAYKQIQQIRDQSRDMDMSGYIMSLTEQVVSSDPSKMAYNTNAFPMLRGANFPVDIVKQFAADKHKQLLNDFYIANPNYTTQEEQNESDRIVKSILAPIIAKKLGIAQDAAEMLVMQGISEDQASPQTSRGIRSETIGDLSKGQRARKLTQRMAPAWDPSIRNRLSDNAKKYFSRPNSDTRQEAEAFIAQYDPLDVYDWLNNNPTVLDGLPGETKVFIYAAAVKALNNAVKDSKQNLDFIQAQAYAQRAADLIDKIAPMGTEYGRVVQAFVAFGQMAKSLLPAHAGNLIRYLENKLGRKLTEAERDELERLANDMNAAAPGLPQARVAKQLANFVGKLLMTKASVHDIMSALWYAHILSGIGTHAKNTFANLTNSFFEFANLGIRQIAKTKDLSVLPFMMRAWWKGLGHGITESLGIMTTGLTRETVAKFGQDSFLEWFRWKEYLGSKFSTPGAVVGKIMDFPAFIGVSPKALRYVGRALAAADAALYTANAEMMATAVAFDEAKKAKNLKPSLKLKEEVATYLGNTSQTIRFAKAQATAEGFTGREYRQRVYELIKETRSEEINDLADKFGARVTFNYEPNGILKPTYDVLVNATKTLKGLKFFIPFLRIVTNLMENYLNYTPIGAYKAWKGGRIESGKSQPSAYYKALNQDDRAELYVKFSMGLMTIAALAAMGGFNDDDDDSIEITAAGTGDYQKNYELMKTGWHEYSIKINGKQFSYKDTPLFPLLALVGSIADWQKYSDGTDSATFWDKSMVGVNWFVQSIFDQSWMSGIDELVSATKGVDKFGRSQGFGEKVSDVGIGIGKSLAQTNFTTQIVRVWSQLNGDPIMAAHGLEKIYRDMPLFNDNLNPIIDVWGRDVSPKTFQGWLPFRADIFPDNPDPVSNFLVKRKIYIGKPERREIVDFENDTTRPMTDDEYYKFIKKSGQLSRSYISELISEDGFSDEPSTEIYKRVMRARQRAREDAFSELFEK